MEQNFLLKTPKRKTPLWRYGTDPGEKEVFVYAMSAAAREEMAGLDEEKPGEFDLSDIRGDMIRLNPTASHIWELCDGTCAVEEILDHLAREYEADREVLLADLKEFFFQFKDLIDVDWSPL